MKSHYKLTCNISLSASSISFPDHEFCLYILYLWLPVILKIPFLSWTARCGKKKTSKTTPKFVNLDLHRSCLEVIPEDSCHLPAFLLFACVEVIYYLSQTNYNGDLYGKTLSHHFCEMDAAHLDADKLVFWKWSQISEWLYWATVPLFLLTSFINADSYLNHLHFYCIVH